MATRFAFILDFCSGRQEPEIEFANKDQTESTHHLKHIQPHNRVQAKEREMLVWAIQATKFFTLRKTHTLFRSSLTQWWYAGWGESSYIVTDEHYIKIHER